MSESSPVLIVRKLGMQPYQDIWQAMHQFTDNRTPETMDEFWLLEHTPVFTQGQAGKPEHLLDPGNIPVVQSDRGGQITYHGPGQLILYLLIDLRRIKLGVRELVTAMEHSVIALLQQSQIEAYAKPDAPGIYVGEAKIASLGLRIRRGCSFHGLALNIDLDLAPFLQINPCGYAGMPMIRSCDLGGPQTVSQAEQPLVELLAQRIGYQHIQYLESNL
ncbi:lipoyl(octanoyl) transferase LipB [Dongshaea marina]|uniref:lipoyl(octanoyl) transferase LipB n=1 Tax=Dongshaea marina TaxID=2047966 RepID=UPI000D3ED23B|nr:lipoyl(octanoyl) transferase LipB [Dongshaea marina]